MSAEIPISVLKKLDFNKLDMSRFASDADEISSDLSDFNKIFFNYLWEEVPYIVTARELAEKAYGEKFGNHVLKRLPNSARNIQSCMRAYYASGEHAEQMRLYAISYQSSYVLDKKRKIGEVFVPPDRWLLIVDLPPEIRTLAYACHSVRVDSDEKLIANLTRQEVDFMNQILRAFPDYATYQTLNKILFKLKNSGCGTPIYKIKDTFSDKVNYLSGGKFHLSVAREQGYRLEASK